ncbi:MAG TPA: glycosyltransferase [Thermoanaerobaculia bacterium]|nr:glycosyltransferase [Thermoanaerobaculia bacterium]
MSFRDVLGAIDHWRGYPYLLQFYGLYPMFMALTWIVMAMLYFHRRESGPRAMLIPDETPFVSVVVPAFEEEESIARTIGALLALDYPCYEIIIVNDGSRDGTVAEVQPFLSDPRVRLLDKRINEGKAMALNDAVPICRGEIIVYLDSDIVATPLLLQAFVPHFLAPRVGAVTGNPRVLNRGSLLRDLQTLEFASIISVQRRAQRIWGRVLTVSGAVFAIRRTALIEVGMFDPAMATEDIDLTWKLQRALWDVRYEPSAVVWMHVPPNLPELWKQRRRWARGLAQVLKRHWPLLFRWRERRMWPVFVEASLSIFWAYTFLFVSAYWLISQLAGYLPMGVSPIPNLWGMLVATACITQLLTGVLMDRRYDEELMHHFPVAIFYPLVYWVLMTLITSIYTIDALIKRPPKTQTWKIRRVACVLFAIVLGTNAVADDCRARNDRGRELAWSDQLDAALEEFRFVEEQCPEFRNSARLRKALVLRWQDRPAAAQQAYETVLAEGNAEERREAELGLGYVDLIRDANRAALARFDALAFDDGRAITLYRLGRVAASERILRETSEPSRDLRDLREPVLTFDRPRARARTWAFHDADGTDYEAQQLGASFGWRRSGRAELAIGRSSLSSIDATWISLDAEHRWSDARAARAEARRTSYDDWSPWSGEADLVYTPRDAWRWDFAIARLLVTDNVAAIENELTGTFVSAGFDRTTLSKRMTWSASADVTRWSAGNRRVRVRFAPRRILDGAPRITIEWPTLAQFYDEPFPFALWSPERSVETGPGVNVYRRWRRKWSLSAYARAGVQRETGSSWQPLGIVRLAIERDLREAWALAASASWSNSNLGSSTGFRRTAVQFELVRRF